MDRRGHNVIWASLLAVLVVITGFVVVTVVRDARMADNGIPEPDDLTLRKLADQRDIFLGVGANQQRLNGDRYRQRVAGHFNSITAQSGVKWEVVQPSPGRFDFSVPDQVQAIADQNDMRVRGHTLIWYHQNPEWLATGDWSRPQLMDIMREHIRTVMGRYRGEIAQWDVVNETVDPLTNRYRDSFWHRIIGPEYIEMAFRWAHRADPEAELYYNDFGIERPGPHFQFVYDMVKKLKADGVPIHGVGLQMHRGVPAPTVGQLQYVIRQFTALGVDVELTELDVSLPLPVTPESLRAQARAYAASVAVCLAEPRCTGVTVWGLDDNDKYPGLSHRGAQTLFDATGEPKPAYAGVALALATVQGADDRPPPTPLPSALFSNLPEDLGLPSPP